MGLLAQTQTKNKAGLLAKPPLILTGPGSMTALAPQTQTQTSTPAVANPNEKSFPQALGEVAADVARAIPRDAASVGISLGNVIDKSTIGKTLDPKTMGPLGTTILGAEPIHGLADTAAAYERKGAPTPIAVLGAVAPIALDFTGVGGSGRRLVTDLVRASTPEEAALLMSKAGFDHSIIKDYAPIVAKTTDTKQVQNALHAAQRMQNTSGIRDARNGIVDMEPAERATENGQAARPLEQMAGQSGLLRETQIRPPLPTAPLKTSSLLSDASKFDVNGNINTNTLRVSDSGRQVIDQTVQEIQTRIEKSIGRRLTNKEALELADSTSSILSRTVSREQTLDWQAKLTKTRQSIAAAADTGKVDRDFIDNLLAVKTAGTDIGRKLQAFSITAEPKEATSMQAIMEAVLDVNKNADEIAQAAKGVDFNDARQATEFYRKFIKPKASEWVDLLRYNSMLSSPLTHIVNAFSNAIGGGIVAPVEKAVAGGLDWLGSTVTGRERKYFAGESPAYVSAYFSNIREATQRFADSLAGKRTGTNLDTRDIPVATGGAKGATAKVLGFPLKLLEASDQFFTALTEAGERAALQLRKEKGARVGNIETEAADKAAYRLYREELMPEHQGHLLDAVDQLTNLIYMARRSKNPIVSNIAKFTVPFVRTPMNIFKQGLEYSPVGYFSLFGAADKTTQLAKAAIGTSVFAGAATLLTSGRLTWAEPTNENDRNAFRAAGRQPYSVKVGNTWVSFQKLPPALAFPFAMVALIDDSIKNTKLDQSTAEMILSGIAKYGDFLADQSYAKSIGDLLSAFQGGESDWARVAGNVPQQLVPFRALGGWLARLTDDVQRKPDPDGTFIEKQVQLLMMNIPGLSQKVPARTDRAGNPVEARDNELNAVSPVRVSTEDPQAAADYDSIEQINRMEREVSAKNSLLKDQADVTWTELSHLPREEMVARLRDLKKANPALHDKVVDIGKSEKLGLTPLEMELRSASSDTRARYILDQLDNTDSTEARRALVEEFKRKKLLTKDVGDRIQKLKKERVDSGQGGA